jgi:hypothetical protein
MNLLNWTKSVLPAGGADKIGLRDMVATMQANRGAQGGGWFAGLRGKIHRQEPDVGQPPASGPVAPQGGKEQNRGLLRQALIQGLMKNSQTGQGGGWAQGLNQLGSGFMAAALAKKFGLGGGQ